MKNLIIVLALSFFSVSSFAQVASVDHSSKTEINKKAQPDQIKIKRHTQSATQQIKIHLNEHLIYPEQMEDYLIEGRIDMEVMISKTGKIKKVKIKKSNSALMDKAVLSAWLLWSKILIRENEYYGNKALNFPIKFSLKN